MLDLQQHGLSAGLQLSCHHQADLWQPVSIITHAHHMKAEIWYMHSHSSQHSTADTPSVHYGKAT